MTKHSVYSVSNVAQLGNFEVLSHPSGSYYEKCSINIKIEKEAEKEGIVQNICLVFNREKLKGSYICNLIAYDGKIERGFSENRRLNTKLRNDKLCIQS